MIDRDNIINISDIKTELNGYLHAQRFITSKNYAESPFIVKTMYNDVTELWMNTLTGDIIYKEIGEEFDEEYLVNHWWKIATDINPDSLKAFLIDKQVAERNITTHENHFNILPTMKCNAHCAYCFEHGTVKEDMSMDTAKNVVKYIVDRYNGVGNVELSWFGGEPTIKSDIISYICDELYKANIPYSAHMTTNGYLLTKIGWYTLRYKWKIHSVQITLDGRKDTYNKVKAYSYTDDENPYETVLQGIELLLKHGVATSIRLNVSDSNKEELISLIDELSERFAQYPELSIYGNKLYETSCMKFSNEQEEKIYDNLFAVKSKLKDFEIKTNEICAATRGTFRTICPDGTILICEHFDDIEGMSLGNVNDTKNHFKIATVKNWQQGRPETERCVHCPIAPMCSIPQSLCPNVLVCSTPYYVNYNKKILSELMKQRYDKYINSDGIIMFN